MRPAVIMILTLSVVKDWLAAQVCYASSCPSGQYDDSGHCRPCKECDLSSLTIQFCVNHTNTQCLRCVDDDRQILIKDVRCEQCQPCPAGFYVSSMCTDQRRTQCAPCPKGTFNERLSYSAECVPCIRCRTRDTAQRCNASQNAKCGKCKRGFYENRSLYKCLKCRSCKNDKYITEPDCETAKQGKQCGHTRVYTHRTALVFLPRNSTETTIEGDLHIQSTKINSTTSDHDSTKSIVLIGVGVGFGLMVVTFIVTYVIIKVNCFTRKAPDKTIYLTDIENINYQNFSHRNSLTSSTSTITQMIGQNRSIEHTVRNPSADTGESTDSGSRHSMLSKKIKDKYFLTCDPYIDLHIPYKKNTEDKFSCNEKSLFGSSSRSSTSNNSCESATKLLKFLNGDPSLLKETDSCISIAESDCTSGSGGLEDLSNSCGSGKNVGPTQIAFIWEENPLLRTSCGDRLGDNLQQIPTRQDSGYSESTIDRLSRSQTPSPQVARTAASDQTQAVNDECQLPPPIKRRPPPPPPPPPRPPPPGLPPNMEEPVTCPTPPIPPRPSEYKPSFSADCSPVKFIQDVHQRFVLKENPQYCMADQERVPKPGPKNARRSRERRWESRKENGASSTDDCPVTQIHEGHWQMRSRSRSESPVYVNEKDFMI